MPVEITNVSWFARIKNAFFGVIFGIILIGFSCYFIFWNEYSSLHTQQSLKQAEQVLISVPPAPINPNDNLKVVYFYGTATTTETLHDRLLNISANALRLSRKVEMYQWKEHKQTERQNNMGGSETETTTYSYNKIWSDRLIDSNRFHEQNGHGNPDHMLVQGEVYQADVITVGDFHLPKVLTNQLSGESPVNLATVDVTNLQNQLNKPVQHDGDHIYVGTDSQQPQIGDLRISETEILPQTVSVIAQQTGNTLQEYLAPAGKAVALLSMGQVSSHDMIHMAEEKNRILTWVIRVCTLLGMIIGFCMIMQPIVILADIVPIFGSIAGFGTGLIGFVLGLCLWSILTAIAWFAARPLMSVVLVAVAILICYFIFSARKNKTVASK